MANYLSNAPLWVIVLFIASFLYSITFITNAAKQAALNAGMTAGKARNIQFGVFGFYIVYLAYVSIFALKGTFDVSTLPPQVIVLGAVPLMVILFVIIGNTRLFKKLLKAASLESLIYIHVFRFVGIFFLILYFYHLLPTQLAFSADMGDIITAALAIPVARAVAKGKSWSIKAVYAWNILGITDIVVALILAVINAKAEAIAGTHEQRELTIFPFVWFPAFAPATILFLHYAVFRKLFQIKAQQKLISK